MARDLDAGASWLVAAGRERGTVGLFDPDGRVRAELVEAIAAAVPVQHAIFEAPQRCRQTVLIHRVGPNVGLGNIVPDELLWLETLRRGLRADTIDLTLATLARGAAIAAGTGLASCERWRAGPGPARPPRPRQRHVSTTAGVAGAGYAA